MIRSLEVETTMFGEVLRGNSNCFNFDLQHSCVHHHLLGEYVPTSKVKSGLSSLNDSECGLNNQVVGRCETSIVHRRKILAGEF